MTFTNTKVVFIIIFFCITFCVKAQNAQEIIALAFEATGSKTAWQNLNTYTKEYAMFVSISGKLEQLGGTKYFSAKKPNLTRMEVAPSEWGESSLVVFDGQEAYIQEAYAPFRVYDGYLKQETFGASFLIPYFLEEGRLFSFELKGTENYKNNTYWVLAKSDINQTEKTWFFYINTETHLIEYSSSQTSLKNETYQQYQNYQWVEGLKIPFERLGFIKGKEISRDVIYEVSINPKLFDSLFQKID